MASQEEPRTDDTRGLPGTSAPQGTAADQGDETSPRETAEQQATPQPAAATAERNGEAAAASERLAEGVVVSPARPRGMASFPGGPPPTVTPVPDLPTLPLPQPSPAPDGPRFRVTTVETTAATRPAGPPPPFVRPAPAALAPEPLLEADAEEDEEPEAAGHAEPPVEVEAGTESRLEVETAAEPAEVAEAAPEVAEVAEVNEATGPSSQVAAPSPEVAAAEAPTDAVDEALTETDAEAPARSGRRRRRGRSGRTAEPARNEVPAPPERTAAPEGASPPAATVAEGNEQPPAPADEAVPAGVVDRGPADAEETAGASGSSSGSARTRARRRRRAAAKARVRTGDPASTAAEVAPAATAEAGSSAAATAPPEEAPPPRAVRKAAAPAAPATAEAAPDAAAPSKPSRRRQRTPAAAPAEAEAEQAPAGRSRGRGRRRVPGTRVPADTGVRAVAAGTDEAAPSRTASPERSTRLEAATRARGARQTDRGRRRRGRGLTEDQKRYLREGVERRMLVTEGAERTQIGVVEGRTLVEHYVTRKAGRSLVGNIYLGRVQNVLPGMEAAFVDIGRGRNAVLYAGEVNYSEEDLDGEAPRIEKALKPGQSILVQVTKDPIGAKGARLTTQVSLAGRYLVLQPEDSTFGISRRLPEAERVRLREILKEVRPKGLGLIVRTAAEGAGAEDLRADLARLQARWEAIERKARKASAPAVIYQEPELVVRVIRDIFSPDFVELVVDAPGLYERVKAYLDEVAPDLLPKMRAHDGRLPLFEQYRVVEQIHKALERKVWLPSGGSLVIDQTEAMTVVDVNTGKYVGKSNLEETVVATNLEAAEEIVRQLRLRDIGGIIIIDFIDMLFEKNQEAVVDRLRVALAKDKTKSQVMEVSSLGLVQMTRKRVSGGLLDSFSETCPACEGRGVVITHEI